MTPYCLKDCSKNLPAKKYSASGKDVQIIMHEEEYRTYPKISWQALTPQEWRNSG
jgi:hypothetical protein